MWDSNINIKKYFHKFRLDKKEKRSIFIQNGKYGLRILKSGFVHLNELKAINLLFKKTLKKFGKIWYNLNANLVLTKKPLETRMGKGKGGITEYVAVVQKGHLIIELDGPSLIQVISLLKKIQKKLHLPTKIIKFII